MFPRLVTKLMRAGRQYGGWQRMQALLTWAAQRLEPSAPWQWQVNAFEDHHRGSSISPLIYMCQRQNLLCRTIGGGQHRGVDLRAAQRLPQKLLEGHLPHAGVLFMSPSASAVHFRCH